MDAMHRVAREFGLLFRSLKSMHSAAVAESGVRVELAAATALTVLADRAPLRPSALAEALQLDLSSVSRQVAALEREGWVVRERDPVDQRATLLQVTPAGRDLVEQVRAARVAHLRRLLPTWSDDELEDFARSLQRFRTDLARAQAAPAADGPAPDRTPALAGQETA